MANPNKKVTDNVVGRFFVDTTCINCDTCRQQAPKTFADNGEFSYVSQQPTSPEDELAAARAVLCCPVGAIGGASGSEAKQAREELPMELLPNIYYLGFNSPKSYGGNSWLIVHPAGNWMIDSPKFLPHLVKKCEVLGGIKYIFLSHRDDVADASSYAEHFGAQRIIHRRDLVAQKDAEVVIEGEQTQLINNDFLIIPTPGHTEGHMVVLLKNQILFTGDHLAFGRDSKRLAAFYDYCWYSWVEQTKSMERLLKYSFEWVIAGHGRWGHLPPEKMHEQLEALVKEMKLKADHKMVRQAG